MVRPFCAQASDCVAALRSDLKAHPQPRAENYRLVIRFVHHGCAFKAGFFPGATQEDSLNVVFESTSWWDGQ